MSVDLVACCLGLQRSSPMLPAVSLHSALDSGLSRYKVLTMGFRLVF